MIKIKDRISIFFFLLIFFLIINSNYSFFSNLNALMIRNHEERLLINYGFCEGVSYGFIKKLIDKKILDNDKIYIINFKQNPLSYGLFSNIKIDLENKTNIILLNYTERLSTILIKENINLSEYSLVHKHDDCYYYKRKIKN